jgi:hypothetical protein
VKIEWFFSDRFMLFNILLVGLFDEFTRAVINLF